MNPIETWNKLFDNIWDWDGMSYALVPGQSISEWLIVVQSERDEIDRMLLDYETIGA